MENSSNNMFYVYIHIRPDTNKPFYVGKGKGNRYKCKSGRNGYWCNIVDKNKGNFGVKILFDNLTEDEALLKEVKIYNDLCKRGFKLSNLAEPGKKGSVGIPRTEEHKKALSKATKGRVSPNKGKKYGPLPENKKYWKGKKRPKTTKNKQSSSQKARWSSNKKELASNFREKVGKKILQIDPKKYLPLKVYPSIIEASEITGISKANIGHCLNNRQKTSGGFIWVYKHPENPYFEYKVSSTISVRLFESNIDSLEEELWHSDKEDRLIEPIGETDWFFQFDNELPIPIKDPIFIPAHKIHRVIKGTDDLKIKITRY